MMKANILTAKKIKQGLAICLFNLGVVSMPLAIATTAEEPPVKKSNNGICHEQGSTYYAKTKHYAPYQTMEKCLKSGGRRPKR